MQYALLRSDVGIIQTMVFPTEDRAVRVLGKISEHALTLGGSVSAVINADKVQTGTKITGTDVLDGVWSITIVPDSTRNNCAEVINHSRKLPDPIRERNEAIRAKYSHSYAHALKHRAVVDTVKHCTMCNRDNDGKATGKVRTVEQVGFLLLPDGRRRGRVLEGNTTPRASVSVCPKCNGTGREKE